MNIYEMYGRQAESAGQRVEELTDFYHKTMGLLRDLADERVAPSRLVVTKDGWEIAEEPAAVREGDDSAKEEADGQGDAGERDPDPGEEPGP